MKPAYWIAIMAIVGSLGGVLLSLLFPGQETFTPATGTAIGSGVGVAIYASQRQA